MNDDPVLRGSDITHPQQSFDEGTGGTGAPNVTFGFTSRGQSLFQGVTKKIAQRGQEAQLPGVPREAAQQHFAVVLDGQLITAPSIDYTRYPEGIDAANGSQISGGFTITSAQNLADELQSGALPIKLALISRSQVSATLGKQALNEGLVAGLAGLAVVCLFLLVFYRVLGAIAVGGLIIYGVYFYALIKLIPITMTLPGIAGLILTIGVAADANIVIFERVKEEIRGGRSVISGIATGYKRGFAAIVDANVVTFMTAFILFALATAEVKGFAFTLGIGTLVSLFTAVLATQAALGAMSRSRLVTHPAALGAGRKRRSWTFDFMGASRWFFSLSGAILLIGALAIGGKGLNLGIDFKSGTRIQTAFVRPATEGQLTEVMRSVGDPTAKIQKISNQNIGGQGYQISAKTLRPDSLKRVENVLSERFGTKNFSAKSIGPTFGKTVARSAIIAIIASLLVISAYIALRFEWKYAVPVLIALMHDLLITAGVYSLTGREVTAATVAALLTILGYSLYDTIIVFDRVRESVPRMPRAAFSQIVNRSMSEVLTRSLATTFCTLLPVTALLFFGGETLKDFAFALLIGIASGAYSSIFIASPVLTHWKEREPAYRHRRERIERELGAVPAYATTASGAPDEMEPERKPKRSRRGRITAPEEPGAQISREEFQDLVRDLDVEGEPTGVAQRGPRERDPAADLAPEDLVLKEPKRREKTRRTGGRRNKRHGRSR
jgi:SecD/SecF fusion protein